MGGGNGGRSDSDVLVPLVDVFIVVFPWATTRNSKTQLDAAYRPSGCCPELSAGRAVTGLAIPLARRELPRLTPPLQHSAMWAEMVPP
jgi:hypothetical protein